MKTTEGCNGSIQCKNLSTSFFPQTELMNQLASRKQHEPHSPEKPTRRQFEQYHNGLPILTFQPHVEAVAEGKRKAYRACSNLLYNSETPKSSLGIKSSILEMHFVGSKVRTYHRLLRTGAELEL
jgi:hypothetical protein